MILVTGGTGVVGGRVVQALLDSQQQVRVFARGLSDWRDNPMPHFRRLGVDVISGDIRNADKVAAAIEGCNCIINLAAIMRETAEFDCYSINAEAVSRLLEVGQQNGVQRFIQLSCLGATQYSHSTYFASKWQSENMVRQSSLYWTIFRPSLIFAPGSLLTRALDFWVSKGPFIPIPGSGLNAISAVSADDVAACIVQSIYNKDTVNKTYDLFGPKSYSLTELLEIASAESEKGSKPVVKIPAGLGLALARFIGKANPRCPITEDVVKTLSTELSGNPQIMLENFMVNGLPFESAYRRLTAQN